MQPCANCTAIVTGKRGAAGHDDLVETGKDAVKPFGQSQIRFTYYVCRTCGTRWRHEDDKNDPHAGWEAEA